MTGESIDQQAQAEIAQIDAYLEKISQELKQGKPLRVGGRWLDVQGLLLVYFNILSSAFNYLSDLKQKKTFTTVQNYAFNVLQNDVHEYQALLGPALKNLETTPCFEQKGFWYKYRYINETYQPLVKLSRTYLPYGDVSWTNAGETLEILWSDGGAYSGQYHLHEIAEFCKHPLQFKYELDRHKQFILQELGKELQDFFVASNSCGTWNSDDFFYWFGYVLNGLWVGSKDNFSSCTIPYDLHFTAVGLLMATQKMGQKYFNPKSAGLYIDMLEHSDFNLKHWRDGPEYYLKTRQKLLDKGK